MTNGPTRRSLLLSSLSAGVFAALPALSKAMAETSLEFGPPTPFSFDGLKDTAKRLAESPYVPPVINDEQVLEAIDYDLHNQIRFRPEYSLWHGEGAGPTIGFFHPGRYFKDPVIISELQNGEAREIKYRQNYFDIPEKHPARQLHDPGFAGFRVMNSNNKNDWLAFLGGTYFRTSGPYDQFGMSVRGLAVNAAASVPEEFPRFSRFWLERNGQELIAYALMEGKSVTGAYRIASQQSNGIIQDVEASIFLRADIERLGIAPLTSMYWYAENNRQLAKDWRPEIHDSDGLEIWTGAGERIWRPLVNPPRVMVNAFIDTDPKGFGLMQRDRNFEQYQDDGVFYEKRASVWVEPRDGWGKGAVQLMEIPTDDEIHDNIGAFWVPAEPARAGDRHDFRYRLHWVADTPYRDAQLARTVATRLGMGGIPGQPRPPDVTKFAVDMEGSALDGFDRESGVKAVINTTSGQISNDAAYPVVGTKRWRVLFDLRADSSPIDLRMFLRKDDRALSETWIYQYFPDRQRPT